MESYNILISNKLKWTVAQLKVFAIYIQLVRICETQFVNSEQNCLQFLYDNRKLCNEQQANKGYI